MKITRYAFSEYPGTNERWEVAEFVLDPVTLFVGRNGSGKSRLLNTIGALATMLSGRREIAASVGHWNVAFENGGRTFEYELRTGEGRVLNEQLSIDGIQLISRGDTGEGEMLSEGIGQNLAFKIPGQRLAAARADAIQYSYLTPLQAWASDLKKYTFGSEFGRNVLFAATLPSSEPATLADIEQVAAIPPENVVAIYYDGYQRFGDKFDKAILKDFAAVGYDCTHVFSHPVQVGENALPSEARNKVPVGLGVKERDLDTFTQQFEMSNGMFRALALIVNLHHVIMSKRSSSILVDDIGEGLDFERSTALIRLLITRCKKHGIQLLMTTNDRFVMNEVDLRYWHIVDRKAHDVRILDYDNSKEIFDKFIFLGLSNFDFFAREAYLSKPS